MLIPCVGTVPQAASAGAAAVDLCASEDGLLPAHLTRLFKTGLSVAIPSGHVGLVCSRSGLALKHSVFVLNAPGVVDSDYRGEIGVILHNAGGQNYEVQRGDRIAQLLIIPVVTAQFQAVEKLPETDRGGGGFGSTGR